VIYRTEHAPYGFLPHAIGHKNWEMLRCEECDAVCDYGAGWIAHLIDDDEEPEQGTSVVDYCPACAAREFGFVSNRLARTD
jgi:hypothetical protein